jgi:hypothetical protein
MQRQTGNAVILRYADGSARKPTGELVSGPTVPITPEVQAERMAACMVCDKRTHTDGDGDICVACGCGSDRRLERLVALTEAWPVKRCRHPRRGSGAGWEH